MNGAAVPRAPGGLASPRLIGLVSFGLALGILSNTLEPALLGHKALQLVPGQKNTALGLTTFAGLLVALSWQPIVGGWSDRTRGPWGRRVPFFLAGTAIAGASMLAIAAAPTFGIVALALLATQLGANTIQGPWQALVPDKVPPLQRGRTAGYKATLEILGFVVGRSISGRLVADGHVLAAAALPGAALLAALSLVLAAVRARGGAWDQAEESLPAPGRVEGGILRSTFDVDWHAHPGFAWWWINRFLFWGGFIVLNTFLLFFLIDVHRMAPPQAQRFVADVSMWLGAAILVVALPAGWLTDRVGRRILVAATGVTAAAGTGMLLLADSPRGVIAAGAVLGLAVGGFLSADWALLTDLVPLSAAARYLGIANIAAAGGSAAARFLGGALIDPLTRVGGHPLAGYGPVFGAALLGFLISAWVIVKVPRSVNGALAGTKQGR